MKECVLILDNIRSVENVGSIFRTADGFSVSKIFLIGTTPTPVDRFGRKRSDFAKVALGAEESMQWEYHKEALPVIEQLRKEGFEILALEQAENSKPLKGYKPREKFALMVGNEVSGVTKEVLAEVDAVLEIPMLGLKESLNVSVAAGVALFELLNF